MPRGLQKRSDAAAASLPPSLFVHIHRVLNEENQICSSGERTNDRRGLAGRTLISSHLAGRARLAARIPLCDSCQEDRM